MQVGQICERDLDFSLKHLKLEMSIRYPCGNVRRVAGYKESWV